MYCTVLSTDVPVETWSLLLGTTYSYVRRSSTVSVVNSILGALGRRNVQSVTVACSRSTDHPRPWAVAQCLNPAVMRESDVSEPPK